MIGEVVADDGSEQIDGRGLPHRERPFFDTGGTIREPYRLRTAHWLLRASAR